MTINDTSTTLIIAGAAFLVLLVFYIIAKVKSNRGDLVLTANGWDMTLLLACPIAIFIAWCWGLNHPLNTAQTICIVIAGLCFVGTAIMSIVHNEGDFMNILISVLAKLFIVWLTLMIILLLITIFIFSVIISCIREHNYDDEYILLKYDRALHAYVGYKI